MNRLIQVLFNQNEIDLEVKNIANKINKIYFDKTFIPESKLPVFICVLNGSFMFFSDLLKYIDFPLEVDFIKTKSYNGTNREVFDLTKDIELDIKHRDVFIIDDIFDSGITINMLINHLKLKNPKNIYPVTLLKRKSSEKHPDLIYGLDLNNDAFIYGYGLNHPEGYGRNIPFILG